MKTIFISLLAVFSLTMNAEVKLQHQGDAAHIVVNGTPMLILGGELSNSAATSIADIDSVMPRMARMGLNTVLVPAQWDLMEADEGKFDFSLIDETINRARENHLKVIFLWFGAWKKLHELLCAAVVQAGCEEISACHDPNGQTVGNSVGILGERLRGGRTCLLPSDGAYCRGRQS
jgi:hypothetical protein